MTKIEIAKRVAKKNDLTIVSATDIVEDVLGCIKEGVLVDGKVSLRNFGTFKTQETKERMGINPKTGEPILIPEGVKVKFVASESFLD